MRFALLGRLDVQSGAGAPVRLPGEVARALVARLLLAGGAVVQRDALIDELWWERQARNPVNALQVQVAKVRAAFAAAGEPDRLHGGDGGYRLLLADDDTLDATAFEEALRRGREEAAAGRHAPAARTLREGLALWRGPALDGLVGRPFEAARVRLETLRLSAVVEAAEAELALDRPREVLAELLGVVREAPLHEDARRLLMLALYRSGRPAEALEVYDEGRRLLAGELGADPSPRIRALHTAILRHDPGLTTAPAEPDTAPAAPHPAAEPEGNLPRPLGPFVGRREELAALRARLAAGRLVTVVGPGGVGKTRLATEACGLPEPHRDAVWWVDLATTDAQGAPAAVAAALGLADASVRPGEAGGHLGRLTAFLTGRRVLLALDNCEHVLDAIAPLAGALLGRCPGLRVVATSREPLQIAGEVLHPLAPMREEEAAELFGVRAAMIAPAFGADRATRDDVRELVRRLDGLPLAVELAVPHVRMLTPRQIADRLDDRFALLTRGDRTAPARHQTLRAVLDWGYALLDPAERQALTRFALYPGGCSLADAEEAGLLPGADGTELVHVLTRLVDKSLLHPVPDGDGMRLRMLETVRAHARDRLYEEGHGPDAERRFTGWALAFAEGAVSGLRSADQTAWAARTAREAANLRAASTLLAERGRTADSLLLEARLGYFWYISGREVEGVERLARSLDAYDADHTGRAGPASPDEEWGFYHAVAWLSWLSHVAGRYADARGYGARNRGYWQRAAHPDLAVLGPCYDAVYALLNADEQVEELFARADAGIAVTRHHWDRANLQAAWSMYCLNRGDVAGAREHGLAGVAAAERGQDAFSRAACLVLCADADESGGAPGRARERWGEAAASFRAGGARGRLASVLLRLACLDLGADHLDAAASRLAEADALARGLASADLTTAVGNLRALLAARRGRRQEAREGFARVWARADAPPARRAVAGLGLAATGGPEGEQPPAALLDQVAAVRERVLEPLTRRAVEELAEAWTGHRAEDADRGGDGRRDGSLTERLSGRPSVLAAFG
ncbi:BTAD domain-containing putative transcriptional regulator [Streptomyces sp. NPDC047097]|uniref:AfsR/SARP family transcriptional regulator n=1 Tax=Streptomyces sp. NPDC047097 TaxID=3155260 RepID=UPI00340DFA99